MIVDTSSYKDIETLLSTEQDVIAYLPIGCTEQHGPVLPMGTDSIIAERMALDLCRLNHNKGLSGVIYPRISYTPSRSNQDYSGSTSAGEAAFRRYVSDISRSIMHHSYSALIFVCMHGPAEPSLMEIIFRANQEQCGRDKRLRPYLLMGTSGCAETFQRHLGSLAGKHADFREFLLAYHLLGTDYFTAGKIERLKSLGAEYRTSPPPAITIPGVNMQYRSHKGIIGIPWPEDEQVEYAQLSEIIWNDLLNVFSKKTLTALNELDLV